MPLKKTMTDKIAEMQVSKVVKISEKNLVIDLPR
tara:strand:- start:442 stop:543 length:102 start_codon:yes stop_codon:yes gene_type:complete